MKKLLVLTLALVMALGLVACGNSAPASTSAPAASAEVAEQIENPFVIVSGNGLSVGMPADIKYVDTSEETGMMVFATDDASAAISFTVKVEDATTPADITEDVLALSLSAGGRLSNVSLDNSGVVEQDAGTSVVGFGKGTTEEGDAMETAIQYFFPADGSGYYAITYMYYSDTANSLADNLELVMSTVKAEG